MVHLAPSLLIPPLASSFPQTRQTWHMRFACSRVSRHLSSSSSLLSSSPIVDLTRQRLRLVRTADGYTTHALRGSALLRGAASTLANPQSGCVYNPIHAGPNRLTSRLSLSPRSHSPTDFVNDRQGSIRTSKHSVIRSVSYPLSCPCVHPLRAMLIRLLTHRSLASGHSPSSDADQSTSTSLIQAQP